MLLLRQPLSCCRGPAQSAIIVNFGGPGASTTSMRSVVPFWLGGALARHDVLLIDDRGRGRSDAIDCPDYQHGNGPLLDIVARCATQLGSTATDYSTADIAADDEAVRAALGYQQVDCAGTSYGGVDASAYATRFPQHLRSLLLDTPIGIPGLDPIPAAAARTRRDIALIGLLCGRSDACVRSPADAVASVRWLADRVRRDPVSGTALDASGAAHTVTIDPTYLLVHILDSTGGPFLTPAEIPAAADALARGDDVPLLRLAAESDFSVPGDNGDATDFSQAAFSATLCLDSPWPWSPDAPLPVRQAQWAAAVHRAPDALFGPFRAEEIMFSVFGLSDFCLPWPQTGTRPPVPSWCVLPARADACAPRRARRHRPRSRDRRAIPRRQANHRQRRRTQHLRLGQLRQPTRRPIPRHPLGQRLTLRDDIPAAIPRRHLLPTNRRRIATRRAGARQPQQPLRLTHRAGRGRRSP
jgi:pimeloyl-ACP methyl ester carboxylesterase